jgi:NAD(P)-dependent dehydrogenase (short-subunit alcohol dehydrogenase family)
MSTPITIVTGAGTGIGRAIALRLAADGHTLGLMARNTERLEATAADARSAGAPVVSVHACDIQDKANVDAAFAAAHERLGAFTGLVANSGIGGANSPGPEDRFAELVQTNLIGTYFSLRAAQAHLAPGPAPRNLLAIASILGRFGVPGYTGYCASKTGIMGLVRALAHELAGEHIRVNAICPGWVDTEMAREGIDGMAAGIGISHDEAYAIAMQQVPLGRMSEPEDIAGVVAWLMSPDARGVTGQGIDINGGAWMG